MLSFQQENQFKYVSLQSWNCVHTNRAVYILQCTDLYKCTSCSASLATMNHQVSQADIDLVNTHERTELSLFVENVDFTSDV